MIAHQAWDFPFEQAAGLAACPFWFGLISKRLIFSWKIAFIRMKEQKHDQ